jgi:hypothetical protein
MPRMNKGDNWDPHSKIPGSLQRILNDLRNRLFGRYSTAHLGYVDRGRRDGADYILLRFFEKVPGDLDVPCRVGNYDVVVQDDIGVPWYLSDEGKRQEWLDVRLRNGVIKDDRPEMEMPSTIGM